MSKPKFFVYTFSGAFLWNLFLTWIGVLLGKEWQRIGEYTQPFEIVVIVVLVSLICWFIFKQIEQRTMKTAK